MPVLSTWKVHTHEKSAAIVRRSCVTKQDMRIIHPLHRQDRTNIRLKPLGQYSKNDGGHQRPQNWQPIAKMAALHPLICTGQESRCTCIGSHAHSKRPRRRDINRESNGPIPAKTHNPQNSNQ